MKLLLFLFVSPIPFRVFVPLYVVVLDGPRRFSLIWYLALLLWLSIVWFTLWYGWRVSVVIRPKFILTDIMYACADRKFRLVACRGSQLCVPDWRFYNRHPVKWLEEIPTSAPEKKTN